MRARIGIAVVGDVRRDSRCLRMARTLAEAYETTVYSLGDEAESFSDGQVRHIVLPRADASDLRASLRAFWKENPGGRGGSADIWLAGDLYSLPLASRMARRQRAALLYDSRELYPYIAALSGRPISRFYWRWMERLHAGRASVIFAVNDSIAERLRRRYPRIPVEVLRNYPDWERPEKARDLRCLFGIPDSAVILLSQGGLQRGRGGEACLRALLRLDNCALVFLGSGAEEAGLRSLASELGVGERAHFHTAATAEELPSYTTAADIGLCIIENLGESYYLSLPNKLFEYAAAGLPVVASDFPEIRKVVLGEKLGLLVDPGDENALADALRHLVEDARARDHFRANAIRASARLNWSTEGARLLVTTADLLRRRASIR